MIAFIDQHKGAHGVEPICRELPIAPSTYYAARSRPPSARAIEDEELKAKILEAYKQNYEVYGVEKIWIALARAGVDVGRDRVARLMGALGIEGLTRGKKPRTTKPAPPAERPDDLVKRDFTAPGPNRLWVADLTYVATWAGFAYTAFIIDVYSRLIVGWRVSTSPWTLWRWRSGDGPKPWTTSCTTATGACSTCRFATPSAWSRRGR